MNKRLYLIVATVLMLNVPFGNTYSDEDFHQIPKLGFLDAEQSRTLLMDGSINIANRVWSYVPISGVNFNAVDFLDDLEPGESINITDIGETVHEPFITIKDRLLRLVKLTKSANMDDDSGYCLFNMIFVSTPIDASFSNNLLIRLAQVESLKDALTPDSRKRFELLFPKKQR